MFPHSQWPPSPRCPSHFHQAAPGILKGVPGPPALPVQASTLSCARCYPEEPSSHPSEPVQPSSHLTSCRAPTKEHCNGENQAHLGACYNARSGRERVAGHRARVHEFRGYGTQRSQSQAMFRNYFCLTLVISSFRK